MQKLFFINSNTSQPFYKPKGYSIQGEVDLIIPTDIWTSIIKPATNDLNRVLPGQNFMQLIKEKVNCSIGIADGRMFKVGLVNATSDFTLAMDSGSLPSLKVKFETICEQLLGEIMPLLNSTYLSNWYKLTLPGYGEVLAESFTQSKVQEAQNKGMIQGDIGVRVMDVGTLYYTSTVSGPILVAETTEFYDIFGLITSNVDLQRLALSGTNSNIAYLLKNAQIQISTEQVRATATFEGDYALDVASYNPTGSVDLLARTARFYDTTFYFGSVTDTYAVISGDININFDLDRNFFLGQGQAPYFSIRGYNSTGNVKIALTPSQYASLSAIVGSFENSGFLNYK